MVNHVDKHGKNFLVKLIELFVIFLFDVAATKCHIKVGLGFSCFAL